MVQERLFVLIPDTLKMEAKTKAVQERVNLSIVIRGLLEAWVKGDLKTPVAPKQAH